MSSAIRTLISTLTLTILPLLIAAAFPVSAQTSPRALCFLEGVEAEWEEGPLEHQIEMTVFCAHADRAILGVDPEGSELELLDGERDLARAGAVWLANFREENPNHHFGTTRTLNNLEIGEPGDERYLEITVHSSARPETGVARLTGTLELIVEADCVGRGATEPVTVAATASQLRNEEPIPFEEGQGGRISSAEVGSSGDDPMLTLVGGGSYVALESPPEGVQETVFFGKKRFVVEGDVPPETEVRLRVCPAETITVPVEIEASAG